MILCIDIGNTNIVVGIAKDNEIQNTFRFVTNTRLTSDEYYQKIMISCGSIDIDGAIISSVVPSLEKEFIDLFKRYYNINPIIVAPGLKSGIKLKIENPKSLGADLLCDCVGAVSKYGSNVLIVDLGTASKFLVINEKSEFIGASIAPGIKSSLNSLVADAALLSSITIQTPKNALGKNTTECIQSGIIFGYASLVDGLINRIKKEVNESLKVILTGGLSSLIKDSLESTYTYNKDLLLTGLLVLYNKNKQ